MFKITNADGTTYTGEKNEHGEPHGQGTYHWRDGTRFEGTFTSGTIQKGLYFMPNGNKYYGTFQEGKRTGRGTYIWKNGDIYEGDFQEDQVNGFGTYWYNNGDKYEGEWKDGQRHGKGIVYIHGSGSFFDCIWGNNQPREGVWVNRLGHCYQGTFLNKKMHGKGVYTWPNGKTKKGEFKKGALNQSTAQLLLDHVLTWSIPRNFLTSKPTKLSEYIQIPLPNIQPPALPRGTVPAGLTTSSSTAPGRYPSQVKFATLPGPLRAASLPAIIIPAMAGRNRSIPEPSSSEPSEPSELPEPTLPEATPRRPPKTSPEPRPSPTTSPEPPPQEPSVPEPRDEMDELMALLILGTGNLENLDEVPESPEPPEKVPESPESPEEVPESLEVHGNAITKAEPLKQLSLGLRKFSHGRSRGQLIVQIPEENPEQGDLLDFENSVNPEHNSGEIPKPAENPTLEPIPEKSPLQPRPRQETQDLLKSPIKGKLPDMRHSTYLTNHTTSPKKEMYKKRMPSVHYGVPLPETRGRLEDVCDVLHLLGEGVSSKVFLGKHKKTEEYFAIKIIPRRILINNHDLAREVNILRRLDHPAVVRLVDAYVTPDSLQIVMELAEGVELFEEIVARKNFSEKDAREIVRKILEGIAYIHSLGIVHRDIKPENLIWMENPKTGETTLKIIDFGFAQNSEENARHTPAGTLGYKSPEVMNGRPFSPKADIWSLGVIVYILLCGFPPFFSCEDYRDVGMLMNAPFWIFFNEQTDELVSAIKTGSYTFPEAFWGKISPEAKDFVSLLLRVDQEQRASASVALEHPWIKGSGKTDTAEVPVDPLAIIKKYHQVVRESHLRRPTSDCMMSDDRTKEK